MKQKKPVPEKLLYVVIPSAIMSAAIALYRLALSLLS